MQSNTDQPLDTGTKPGSKPYANWPDFSLPDFLNYGRLMSRMSSNATKKSID